VAAPIISHRFRRSEQAVSERIREGLGICGTTADAITASLPFAAGDVTAGVENELQTVVIGGRDTVDLPRSIQQSNYYKNILRRTLSGDTSQRLIADLDQYLNHNRDNVWEHSWVRFPYRFLSAYACSILHEDLRADKSAPQSPLRSDTSKFLVQEGGERCVRVPVSYLLKLALADAVSASAFTPEQVRQTGRRFMDHFLNDNTSPETFSFYTPALLPERGMGVQPARETALRFLLTQLLTQYAETRFGLAAGGQRVLAYFAPHPPVRQKRLNGIISDGFYRELFMSPCLSGWDRGQDKHQYMILCHQVLSRSQLNTLAKLKEAGIITRDLVVLPNLSNISLANNGTHVSLGSRRLTGLLASAGSAFTAADEKLLGDLAIKIVEHFLPLFVGTYSAAPYRLEFGDFHPETVLGFLPHELDYTHLRMLWRRWKLKADVKIMGQPLTPFGPPALDRFVSGLFRLRGDFVPDYRLIDYLVALMSTDQSPALDGTPGNDQRLKKDLADLGVFDERMAPYLFYRLRQHAVMGFSGFEGRYYSLFENMLGDMADAVSLQTLITALAYKYIVTGRLTHRHIPDGPALESERRQIFFGAAIGIPTFFVRSDSGNRFMLDIVGETKNTRQSSRYHGYIRCHNIEYQRTLLAMIRRDGAELVEAMDLRDMLDRLEERINRPASSAAGRLTAGILNQCGGRSPMDMSAGDFNAAAEGYYRTVLRRRHCEEAFSVCLDSAKLLDRMALEGLGRFRETLAELLDGRSAAAFIDENATGFVSGRLSEEMLRTFIALLLLCVQAEEAAGAMEETHHENTAASVY
jgi:hypothetical protein